MNHPETSTRCLFSSYLKISYDQRFIATAQETISQLARLSGADDNEAYQLTMLVEESLVFIMDKYIDDKFKAHIEIGYLLFDGGKVVLEFSDMGSPIHQEKIPEFNLQNTDTADGLWYHMVRKMTDRFEFINRLMQGWLIRMEKTLKAPSFACAMPGALEAAASPSSEPVTGSLSIRMATADDAAALVDLAFMTYRYSNGVPEFYDAALLRAHIEDGLYDIMVVETNHRVIGALSVKYSPYDPKSAEMGSAMVHPDYRKTRALFLIIRETSQYHMANPRQIDFFVTYLVTTHTRSQKAVEKVHRVYRPLSVSLNMIPRPNYVGIKEIAGTRESLLNAYHLNGELGMDTIHVPAPHAEIIRELIANTGNPTVVSADSAEPTAAQTDLSSFVIASLGSAIVTVETIGADWFPKMCQTLLTLTTSKCQTIIVSLPTSVPLPADLDEKLAGLKLVFCGLSLRSLQDVRLSYVLTSEPVDFSLIELHSPVAKNLLAHIEKHYRANGLSGASPDAALATPGN